MLSRSRLAFSRRPRKPRVGLVHCVMNPESEAATNIAISLTIYRVIWAFRPKVGRKSRKGFSGPLGQGPKKSENNRKSTIQKLFQVFNSVFDIFLTFWAPGAERPREPFSRVFSDFGPKRPNDPCKWSMISQNTNNARFSSYFSCFELGESPSTITIMNRTSRWTSG